MSKQSSSNGKAYEKVVIWAEEGAAISANQQEWSFGNGATGQIGITIADDWELYKVTLNGDVSSTGGPITIEIRDNSVPAALTTVVFPIGTINNYAAVVALAVPIAVTEGMVLGFRTVTETGANNDFRVACWLRREA